MALKLYTDAACTNAVGVSVAVVAYTDHSEGAQDFAFYLADVEADAGNTGTLEVVATSAPGVDNIALSIADGDSGGGQQASELKLASTAAGLDSAVAGADLQLGTSITAGVGGGASACAFRKHTNGARCSK